MTAIFLNTYPSSLDASRSVSIDIRAYWESINISDDTMNEAELCLVEIVNNAFEHAYCNQEGKIIEVKSYLQNPCMLIIEISDYGRTLPESDLIDSSQQDFTTPEEDKPETWHTSGRGFIIVEQLMDSLAYEHNEGKNTFYLGKRLHRV